MKRASSVFVAILLAGCGAKYDGTSVPVLQPVPHAPGRYFDQGVSAWHYVHVQSAARIPSAVDALPVTRRPSGIAGCPSDISEQVCKDWIKNGRRRP